MGDMTRAMLADEERQFQPRCFFTGFNGPLDPGYACVAHTNSSDPLTISQALKRPDWLKWEEAITEELKALAAFDTFEVCDLPPGKRQVGCKYVFKIKYKTDGSIEKYKVRLVAQGFLQQEGIDYNEIFAPHWPFTWGKVDNLESIKGRKAFEFLLNCNLPFGPI